MDVSFACVSPASRLGPKAAKTGNGQGGGGVPPLPPWTSSAVHALNVTFLMRILVRPGSFPLLCVFASQRQVSTAGKKGGGGVRSVWNMETAPSPSFRRAAHGLLCDAALVV